MIDFKIIEIVKKHIYLSALFFGSITCFAFAPFFIFPIIIISLIAALFLIDLANNIKQAFYIGWCFGFGKFTTNLYWIANALLIEENSYIWLIPFANILLPTALGLYFALAFAICYLLTKDKNHSCKIVIFAANVVFCEYLRSILFTGFPWNLIGYSLGFSLKLSQIASVTGIYGLSFIVIILSGYFYLMILRRSITIILSICIIYSSLYLYGQSRLKSITEYYDIDLHIVQGNISQNTKWQQNKASQNLETYINLSKNTNDKTYIIWPESAIPYSINDVTLLKYLSQIIPHNGLLITGAIRNDINDTWYNSINFINNQGKIIASYDKTHLVPFGEYIPLKKILPDYIKKITHGIGDFNIGIGPQTIKADLKLPDVSPISCYEVIFPSEIINKKMRSKWMLNLTNDAWFGKFVGPLQHFHMSRMRAIEEGIPLVRVANTGISAVIDGYGRIIVKTNMEERKVIQAKLPKENYLATIYSIYGNKLIISILICVYISYILMFIRNKINAK